MGKFPLGEVLVTSGARDLSAQAAITLLVRHISGDWGDVCKEDAAENEYSLIHGFRLFSVYHVNDVKYWVITESNRSVTTILLPEEY